jgi:hypothetical protein
MAEIKVAKNFAGSHSGRDTERPSPVAGSLSAFMLEKGSTGRGSKGYGQAYAAWNNRRRQDKARGIVTPTNVSKTPSMSTPRGYQYDPSTYKAPAVPKVSTTSSPSVGYKNPRDMAGKTKFTGTTMDKVKVGAAIVGGFAAVPAAVIAAPIIAGGVAGASAIGAYGGLGAGLAGASGLAAKFVRGAGGAVSKGARGAASPWLNTAKPLTRVPKRVVKPKVTKPKVTKPKTDPVAAMVAHTGALAQQNARMGGGPRGGSR